VKEADVQQNGIVTEPTGSSSKPKRGGRKTFGIGEWYGRLFTSLNPQERIQLANLQDLAKKERRQICLPRSSAGTLNVICTKDGGVCSIREYVDDVGSVSVSLTDTGKLATTCPHRFHGENIVFPWISEVLLGTDEGLVLSEVGFLEKEAKLNEVGDDEADDDPVGLIDRILVHPTRLPLQWCAVEMQAVYFSGAKMGKEFSELKTNLTPLPFPKGRRHPDYRSSGPKRLMPQLQIKVPTLRRWGKRMAVVVDESFFASLGKMDAVKHVSNCDIAWFIVGYEEKDGRAVITKRDVRLTTLERAVEGLTGGQPVELPRFESEMVSQLKKRYPATALANLSFGQ
jgi:hypothetical protein